MNSTSSVPERGVPLTAETVGLLQPGDWLQHPVHGVVRYWASLADDMYLKDGPFIFLGRPDAGGWIAHDGGENPAPGLTVEVKIRWRGGNPSEGAVCSDEMRWNHVPSGHGDGGDIIAWRPHVSAAPALSTAETVVVPVEPTEAMIKAGERAAWDYDNSMPAIRAMPKAWSAMLNAAPAREPEGGAVTKPDEMTENALRSRAKALLRLKGWRAGDKIHIHGMIELLTQFGMDVTEKPEEDRCNHTECGCDFDEVCDAALTPKESPAAVPADVARLVIAARNVAFDNPTQEVLKALDIASEAFASRVPWEDEPDDNKEAPAATGAGEREAAFREGYEAGTCDGQALDAINDPDAAWAASDALRAQPQAREEGDETYDVGKRDGYEQAVQDIDVMTGGDGEYVFATDGGGCPDVETMKARIVERTQAREEAQPVDGDWQSIAMWMGFAASVIKSGEPWTDQCQREFDEALAAYARLSSATTPPSHPLAEGADAEKPRERLRDLMDMEFAKDWRTWSDERAIRLLGVGPTLDAFLAAREAALQALSPSDAMKEGGEG